MTSTSDAAGGNTLSPLLFSLGTEDLSLALGAGLGAEAGHMETRDFPDGESYLRVLSPVAGQPCLVVADLSHPNSKYLPLIFLLETLRELGAGSVGLVAPYLSYMRQDIRFHAGEAVTSRLFAADLSQHIDWLVTVDPHLHRYKSLDDIYSVPAQVVAAAPALAAWLTREPNLLLVGPDAESEQWVSEIARIAGHPYVIGQKERLGDRQVRISLPDLSTFKDRTAVIVDDVISSGHTIIECARQLQQQRLQRIDCVAVHGLFGDGVEQELLAAGVARVATCNTIGHPSNAIDVTSLLIGPVKTFLDLNR